MFGAVRNERVAMLKDLGKREFVVLGAMAVLVLGIGVHPKTFTDAIGPSVEAVVSAAQASSLPADDNAPSYDAHRVEASKRLPG
jgi:NADH-quinone oxidoreductase subunit M